MKVQELRKKSDQDLRKLEAELKQNLLSLRFKVASKEVKNHQVLNAVRKDIARILTIVKEREHEQTR